MARGDVVVAPDGDTVTLTDVGQRIVFENQHVRVWDLVLEPGERQAWHEHDHPYLVIGLEAADNRVDFLEGTEPLLIHESVGGVVYREAGGVHMVTNHGTTRYRSRVVELKAVAKND